jgi:phosphatidate cytidylyltransferase
MVRLLSGVTLAAIALAVIWFSTPAQLLVVTLGIAGLAFREYAGIAGGMGVQVPRVPALVATLAACAMVPFPWVAVESVLGLSLLAIAVWVLWRGRHGAEALHDTGAGVLAPVYIGLPLGAVVAILGLGGRLAVLLLIATVAVSDTAQYYSGRSFGKRPLAPRVSPKKTVEGAIGGFVIAPLFLVAAAPYALPQPAPAWALAALGLVLVVAGICGDLFESLLKRAANLKDSGGVIPGHGGVLDRIDALLFCAPVFYFALRAL